MKKQTIATIHAFAFLTAFVTSGALTLAPDLFTLGTLARFVLIAVCIGIEIYTLPALIER